MADIAFLLIVFFMITTKFQVDKQQVDLPPTGQIWSDHVKANETKGLKASLIRSGANGARTRWHP